MTTTPIFEARGIEKSFGHGQGKIQILNGINLTISAGEMAAIIGASGSGKTTLLQILGTLDKPDAGEILFNGNSLARMNEKKLARHRNKAIGFIFQFHHLLPEFTALENVMMPALINGQKKEEARQPALDLLGQVELDHRASHKVAELSGGEQQRAALARALIMNPALLLADEPTGNLDSRSGNIVFDLLQSLCAKRSLAAIMVTHNMELTSRMDRCLTLRDGLIEEQ